MYEFVIVVLWKKKLIINNVIYGFEMYKIVNIVFLW